MNGDPIVLNAELIETVESRPDTLITLTSGNRIMVKEEVAEVVDRVREYQRDIRMQVQEKQADLKEERE
jgi:flagellar protein FlbD